MKVLLKNTAKLFQLFGYWPLKIKNSRTSIPLKIYFYLNMTIFILTTLGMWLEVPNAARNGLKQLVSNVSIGFQFTYGGMKLLCFSLPRMRSLFQKAIVTEKNILQSKNGHVKAIYMKYVNVNNKLDAYLIGAILTNAFAFVITPWIMKMSDPNDDDEIPSLPLDVYLPFDYRENYKIAFVLSVIGGLVTSVYIMACNMTYVGLMVFIISQLEILKHEITEGIDTMRFNNEQIYQNLRQVVVYYTNVMKFVIDFNRLMKLLNLLYFLLCTAHTSMICFEVVTDDFSFQLVRNIWYLGVSLGGELFIWYWFGNKITSQHSAILDTIWESDWYKCNIKNKKTILIVMMQVQKPLRLSVGFSHYMSLATMTRILKSSMSYTITLRQFYSMKEVHKQ